MKKQKSEVRSQDSEKGKRIVMRKHAPMLPEERAMAFSVPEEHPLWRAIHEMLSDNIDDYTEMATNPAIANQHGSLAYATGGLSALRDFQEMLHDIHVKAVASQK